MMDKRALSKSDNAATPVTPPTRHISSTLSTPGSTYGKEEDAIILELTQRYIKVGIEGEGHAQCFIKFGPEKNRRHGDFRAHLPGHTVANESIEEGWGKNYELWRNDLKDVDLGLLADKLERVIREIYNNILLVDAGNARLVLTLPSLLPHPVLSTILQTLFERWAFPSITLLSVPATVLVAAGVRSGLVVDIGWEETVVTAVYEYREVRSVRTTRAVRLLTQDVAKVIEPALAPDQGLSLETVEDILCKITSYLTHRASSDSQDVDTFEPNIMIDWPAEEFTKPVKLNVCEVRRTMRTSLLGIEETKHYDDEELPVDKAIYKCLQLLLSDVRGLCLARIVFNGTISSDPHITSTIIRSLSEMVRIKGWTDVELPKEVKRNVAVSRKSQAPSLPTSVAAQTGSVLSETTEKPIRPERPLVEERYLREKARHAFIPVHGVVRQLDSLGAWEGASLLTTLKVKSFVEIQRDRFLSHGLSGASRDMQATVLQPKVTAVRSRNKAGERQSWTLSGWG